MGEFNGGPEGRYEAPEGNDFAKGNPGNKKGKPDNLRNLKHGLHATPWRYRDNLEDPEKIEEIEQVKAAILQRLQENQGVIDTFDEKTAEQLATRIHLADLAADYLQKEGMFHEEVTEYGVEKKAHPAASEYRRYTSAIIKDMKNLGVLRDPDTKQAEALTQWKSYISNDVVEPEPEPKEIEAPEPEEEETPGTSEELEDYLRSNEFTDEEKEQLHTLESEHDDRIYVHLLIDDCA